jgi:hypothetical protein
MKMKHELGAKAKSKVVGMEGIITSRSENLYGCNRYFIQPRVGSDGKVIDGWWFDEDDIDIIELPVAKREHKNIGGPISRTR